MDAKTKNVVIDEYLNTKIIDFSISIDYRDFWSNSIIFSFW